MRPSFKFALWAFGLFVIVGSFFFGNMSARDLTHTRMVVNTRWIMEYARQHNRLPVRLADLPEKPGYEDDIVDAWNRPFDYDFDAAGAVTLRSLGSDRLVGGDGDKSDMTVVFFSRDDKGDWKTNFPEWSVDPRRPAR